MFATVRALIRDDAGGAVGNVAVGCLILVAGTMIIQPPRFMPLLGWAVESARAHMPASIGEITRALGES